MAEQIGEGEPDLMVLSVLAMEAWLESRGWDEPPIVMALLRIEGPELEYAVLGEGDPYEILIEAAPTSASLLLVAAEMWAWPPDLPESEQAGRPSEHPDRVEIRSVVALDQSGQTIGVVRQRGEAPFVERSCSGTLVDAMGAALAGADR